MASNIAQSNFPQMAVKQLDIALQLDLYPSRSPCSSGQDRRQTAGPRNLTEYVTVIQNVSTKVAFLVRTGQLGVTLAVGEVLKEAVCF
jgi:hypothetical protein